jgi:hypothetical protein
VTASAVAMLVMTTGAGKALCKFEKWSHSFFAGNASRCGKKRLNGLGGLLLYNVV